MLECRTALTVALGYRDLKPPVAGLCGLTGTDLEGRYERLLGDLRARWTADLGERAVRAIAVLQERADSLETSLNREVGGLRTDITTLDATVADLRAEIGEDEALIELVAYRTSGAAGPGAVESRRYGAFVLDKTDLGWADLGPGAPIDASVADLLNAAQDWSTSAASHEDGPARVSMRTAQDALRDLSRRVWRPIAPLLGGAQHVRRLRIAPDGALNLVPFEALSDGQDLIERYTIRYVPAGRDLLDAPSPAAPSAPVIIVSPGRDRAAAASSSASAGRIDLLAPLDGAAGEAADARRLLPGSEIYTGRGATEQHVKGLRAPALLLIVGHGVVRGADECQPSPCLGRSIDSPTQAMSLAAIVLEEAYGRGGGSRDDGMLTALELENMNLRGTEMLVLSQCRMASGLPSVGEGVYGMRRAAAIAGVHTFVAPLWNVDDRVQRRLMRHFYQELAAGRTRADALRSAKLLLRQTPQTRRAFSTGRRSSCRARPTGCRRRCFDSRRRAHPGPCAHLQTDAVAVLVNVVVLVLPPSTTTT